MQYIEESGMKFGPFPEDCFFHIEASAQYQKLQQDYKISEFLYYKKETDKLLIVEAKTSAPRDSLEKYIANIKEKFENTLDLYTNMLLKKELPETFTSIDYKKVNLLFILVIKKSDDSWLPPVKDALEKAFPGNHRAMKLWNCKCNRYKRLRIEKKNPDML